MALEAAEQSRDKVKAPALNQDSLALSWIFFVSASLAISSS
jgi:hypothetical protein